MHRHMNPRIGLTHIVVALVGLLISFFPFATICLAQDQEEKRGFNPGGSYALSDLETINTVNGNMILRFPLGKLPPGRGGLSAAVNLLYNSKLFDTQVEYVPNLSNEITAQNFLSDSEAGGWRYGFRYDLELKNRLNDYDHPPQCPDPRSFNIWKLKMTFPDGSTREFRPLGDGDFNSEGYFSIRPDGRFTSCSGNPPSVTTGMTYYTTDGTYMRLSFPHTANNSWQANWTLSMPDGTRVVTDQGAQRVYDRNNNYIQIGFVDNYNNTGHPGTVLTDQVGRSVAILYDSSTQEDLIRVSGVSNEPLTWAVKWKAIQANKSYRTTAWGVPSNERGGTSTQQGIFAFTVVDRITLPAQSGSLSYVFGYNAGTTGPSFGWGEVSSITLPSEAQVTYGYKWDGGGPLNGFLPDVDDVLENHPRSKTLSYQQEYDNALIPTTETWHYSISRTGSSIIAPDGGGSSESFGDTSFQNASNGLVHQSTRPDGTVIERIWKQNLPLGLNPLVQTNPFVKTEFTSIKDAAGHLSKTTIKDFSYDKNGNVTQVKEYDWVDYDSVPRVTNGGPTGSIPSHAVLKRVTTTSYWRPTPDALNTTASTGDCYWNPSAPSLRTAVASSEISDHVQTLSRAEFFYDNPATTGNVTQQTSWDSTKGSLTHPLTGANSIAVSHQYDAFGNPLLSTDARGHQTQFFYGLVGAVTDLYPTQIKTAFQTGIQRTETKEYDFHSGVVTRVTDLDNNVSTSTEYDAFGRPILVRAAEGKPEEARTTTEYSDVFRRVIVRSDLNTLGDEKLVSIQHYDQLGRVRLSRQLEDAATQNPTDETQGIKVQTRYMFNGPNSYVLISNPYRSAFSSGAGGEETMGWMRSKNDIGGRLIEVQTFGGAGLPAPWATNATSTGIVTTAYDANFTTVTDQAGKVRRSVTNGLGQLVRVDEPDASGSLGLPESPAQPTSYSYDALGNLRQVTQGQQQRFFSYNSLSRLIRARNPEQEINPALNLTDSITGNSQWSFSYVYDNNGNLLTKKEARNITSSYVYDALNRLTHRSYDDGTAPDFTDRTPAVTYNYDSPTIANGKGRLVSVISSVSSYSVSGYDAMGDALGGSQTIGSQTYPIGYTYDLAGHVKSMTYPSGKTVTYSYDEAGRLNDFRGNLGDATQRIYATGITYDSSGGWTREQFGTTIPLYNKRHYNNRQQLYDMRVSTVNNDMDGNRGGIVNYYSLTNPVIGGTGPDTNGNLYVQQHWIPTDDQMSDRTIHQQNYSYDSLNRITSVNEYLIATGQSTAQNTGSQTYAYDRYGNRTVSGTGMGINNLQFDDSESQFTNRLFAPGDTSLPMSQRRMQYDAAGNLKTDTYSGKGLTRVYDGENRMTSETQVSFVAGYSYDGDGRRVKRNLDGAETWQVYGLRGELLAEYPKDASPENPQKEYGYRNGELLVTATVAAGSGGAPPTFTPPTTLVAGTVVKLEHLTELRTAVNQLRVRAGLSAAIWPPDLDPQRGVTFIKADHILQLRMKLEEALLRLHLPTGGYEHPTLNVLDPIYAIDFQELRDQVLTAWNSASSVQINWLVTDHLGTPRMIFDQTGSLANVSRHDYLPFGEELANGQGNRTPEQGYDGDGVRQRFTSYERDNETGLDYAQARYYANVQGRFVSVDPLQESAKLEIPQSWNRYAYVLNNPLVFIDPTGELWIASGNAGNPYSWVDACPEGGICYESVAAIVTADDNDSYAVVYGATNATDITAYRPNEHGMIDLSMVAGNASAQFVLRDGNRGAERFANLETTVGLFNATAYYAQQHPDDDEIIVTNSSLVDGTGSAAHPNSHGRPNSAIDFRYLNAAGQSVQGPTAAASADANRMSDLFDAFTDSGFNQSVSGRPRDFGSGPLNPNSERGRRLIRQHQNHGHVGIVDRLRRRR